MDKETAKRFASAILKLEEAKGKGTIDCDTAVILHAALWEVIGERGADFAELVNEALEQDE